MPSRMKTHVASGKRKAAGGEDKAAGGLTEAAAAKIRALGDRPDPIFGRLEPTDDWRKSGTPPKLMVNGQVVMDPHRPGKPILDFPFFTTRYIPDVLPTWQIEFWFKQDSRLTYADIRARQRNPATISNAALCNRRTRDVQIFMGCGSWNTKYTDKRTTREAYQLMASLTDEQCRLNTCWKIAADGRIQCPTNPNYLLARDTYLDSAEDQKRGHHELGAMYKKSREGVLELIKIAGKAWNTLPQEKLPKEWFARAEKKKSKASGKSADAAADEDSDEDVDDNLGKHSDDDFDGSDIEEHPKKQLKRSRDRPTILTATSQAEDDVDDIEARPKKQQKRSRDRPTVLAVLTATAEVDDDDDDDDDDAANSSSTPVIPSNHKCKAKGGRTAPNKSKPTTRATRTSTKVAVASPPPKARATRSKRKVIADDEDDYGSDAPPTPKRQKAQVKKAAVPSPTPKPATQPSPKKQKVKTAGKSVSRAQTRGGRSVVRQNYVPESDSDNDNPAPRVNAPAKRCSRPKSDTFKRLPGMGSNGGWYGTDPLLNLASRVISGEIMAPPMKVEEESLVTRPSFAATSTMPKPIGMINTSRGMRPVTEKQARAARLSEAFGLEDVEPLNLDEMFPPIFTTKSEKDSSGDLGESSDKEFDPAA